MLIEIYNATSLGPSSVLAADLTETFRKRGYIVPSWSPIVYPPCEDYTQALKAASLAMEFLDCEMIRNPPKMAIVADYCISALSILNFHREEVWWKSGIPEMYRLLTSTYGLPAPNIIAILTDDTTSAQQQKFFKACQLSMLPVFIFTANEDNLPSIFSSIIELATNTEGRGTL